MTTELAALVAHARSLPALERARLAEDWTARKPAGTLLVATCHRVELYGSFTTLAQLSESAPAGTRLLRDSAVVKHLVQLAVGRQSAVVGEDQILHQLRVAAKATRAHGGLAPELDRLLDIALHAGRRARSWLPASRVSLADVALARAIAGADLHGAHLIVVGTGEMGRRAVGNLVARGGTVTVVSRTRETARSLGERYGANDASFDPGPEALAGAAGVFVALGGPWAVSPETRGALLESAAWLVDLSVPGALDDALYEALKGRLVLIDDMSRTVGEPMSERLLGQLDRLADEAVAEYDTWLDGDARRTAADALARRAQAVQASALERLSRRVPTLDDGQRLEVERALEGLARQLLRDPLEQLMDDADGRKARAARDLFRL